MYEVIKTVIETGEFELTDILKKIDIHWISGKITDEERTKLIQFAQGKANPQNSVNNLQVLKKLAELEKRIKAVEDKQNASENTDEEGAEDTGEETPVETYPEYVAGKWYYNGDKCSEDGKNYTCIAPEGQVCVWKPSEYPAYWELEE